MLVTLIGRYLYVLTQPRKRLHIQLQWICARMWHIFSMPWSFIVTHIVESEQTNIKTNFALK